ncbi:hypothetical protein LZ012_11380 [Dechloromonas sp. XY25]|uniref:Uncharacterized protein n=1 Tax=Dechloromonas hankyongensis TaxID=2908002 RepID=A0ABS9K338_9RHOO|nr:hypothetical protein [Dechloromonas hankyongensis]MCG2577594.1 hypothetical protein [Dechloromonas hankyongensis]
MGRIQRNFILAALGLLLTGVFTWAHAGSYWKYWSNTAGRYYSGTDQMAACSAWAASDPYVSYGTSYPKTAQGVSGGYCIWKSSNFSANQYYSGEVVTCTDPNVPNENGVCGPPPSRCAGKDQLPPTFAWVSFNKGNSPYGSRCNAGCLVYQTGPVSHPTMNPNGDAYVGGTHDRHELMKTQYTATECTVGQDGAVAPEPTVEPNKAPPPTPKKPNCDASEGVLTTSKGTVACVPEGTVEARKPTVQRAESKATAPNGDVTVTNKTTTTDPATGAKETVTSTTTTTFGGGSTTKTESTTSGGNGQNGLSDGDNSGSEPGQCAKEPNSPMCKQGTVKDKGKFDNGQDTKLNEAKQALTDKFNQIKTDLTSALSSSAGVSSGSLPCPPPVTVLGKQISICVNNYADKLSPIGAIVVFAAAIIAILLVVTV